MSEFADRFRVKAMKSGTVATHLDDHTLARLKQAARTENRSLSQLQRVALKALLDLSPGARNALLAIDGIADDAERRLAAKRLGRAALAAYEQIIDARSRREQHPATNESLDTEAAIEGEAVRLCRL
jgi:cytochrome P450